MAIELSDDDWEILLDRIVEGGEEKDDVTKGVTPFLGPRIRSKTFPKRDELCKKILRKNKYPFGDEFNLPLAALYTAGLHKMNISYPKNIIATEYNKFELPDDENDPHRILAELPFKLYMTTNYDLFMYNALDDLPHKDPKKEVCWWKEDRESILDQNPPLDITIANPVVFYIFGHFRIPRTLVLNEDEYFDFTINISKYNERIPSIIQDIITSTQLLFLGYDLKDIEFRVLLRCLKQYYSIGGHRHTSVYVLDKNTQDKEKAEVFLEKYLDKHEISIHFGDCNDFIVELKDRYRESKRGNQTR